MNLNQNLIGSCGCGKVKYNIKDDPLFTQACHCKLCKKSTGSSFVIHTMVFEDNLIVEGAVSSSELETGSGKGYRAYFCVNCGVYVYCKYNVSPGRVAVRTATLNNPIFITVSILVIWFTPGIVLRRISEKRYLIKKKEIQDKKIARLYPKENYKN